MTALVEIDRVSKRFGGVQALSAVSLRAHAGEIVAVIGPNGAGKTTLLNCLAGDLAPDEGDVRIDDVSVVHLSPDERVNLGLGRTFQQLRLFSSMTVRQNLLVAAEVAWANRRAAADSMATPPVERVDATLEYLDLAAHEGKNVNDLSLGVRRRVELGRALCLGPRVLVLDEPAAGLDASETAELGGVIEQLRQVLGIAVIYVEHDLGLVLSVSDYIYVLNFGQPLADGAPQMIRDHPAVVEAYFGTPL